MIKDARWEVTRVIGHGSIKHSTDIDLTISIFLSPIDVYVDTGICTELYTTTTNRSQILLSSIAECHGGKWKVTRVVTNEELGRPVERLMEQIEKLRLYSSHRALTRSEEKKVMLEKLTAMAERVRRLEGEKQADETKVERKVCIH